MEKIYLTLTKRPFKHFIFYALFLFFTVLGGHLALRAGVIDSTFNAQLQTSTFRSKYIQHLVTQADGKILAQGTFNKYNGQMVGSLIRLNADGSLDNQFNNDLLLAGSSFNSINPLPNGKILIHGTFLFTDGTTLNNTVVRLNADGTVDSSFTNGVSGYIREIKIDADGRPVLWGNLQVTINGTAVSKPLVRLNEDGAIDSSFVYQPAVNCVEKLGLQGNKPLYYCYDFSAQQNKLMRLNEDGSADSTFAPTLINSFNVLDLKAQADNKILIAGDNRIFRVKENGGLDNEFSLILFPGPARRPLYQNDGKFIVAYHNPSAPFGMMIVRYHSSGATDDSFAPYNFTGMLLGGYTIDLEGRVLLGEESIDSPTYSLNKFTRLLPSGLADSNFNAGGEGFFNVNPGRVRAIGVFGNGKILIGGDFDKVGNTSRRKIALLNPDSSLDPAFQINTSPTGNYFSDITDVYNFSVQTDGKILVSGGFTYVVSGAQKSNIVRLNPNGSIDPTFNLAPNIMDQYTLSGLGKNKTLQMTGGKVLVGTTRNGSLGGAIPVPVVLTGGGALDSAFNPTVFNSANTVSVFDTIALQDGKILIAGRHITGDVTGQVIKGFVARLNANGSVDQGFQIFEQTDRTIFAFARTANGKLLIVPRDGTQSSVLRLNLDGTPDNSFNTGNGANGLINSILVLPDNKILIGGVFTTYNNQPRKNIALLNEDGTLAASPGNVNKEILCLTLDNDGRVLIGGNFTSASNGSGGQQFNIPYLLRLNTSSQAAGRAPFDFDGDAKTDISIFRPAVGEWWYLRSSNGTSYAARFGNSTDKTMPADFTGDGRADIALFRPATGEWFVLRSEDGSFYSFPFGTGGDTPVAADFDADGAADAAVFRPSNSTWYIRKSSDGNAIIRTFGQTGDVPVAADYDNDGKADLAIYRPSGGEWWIERSTAGLVAFQFGNSSDKPVQGDYTGDGKSDAALFRPNTGEWFVLRSENQSFYSFPFGTNGDVPSPGDYDGDGKFDATVFRPSNSTWYSNRSTAGTLIQSFGQSGDVPVPNAFVP